MLMPSGTRRGKKSGGHWRGLQKRLQKREEAPTVPEVRAPSWAQRAKGYIQRTAVEAAHSIVVGMFKHGYILFGGAVVAGVCWYFGWYPDLRGWPLSGTKHGIETGSIPGKSKALSDEERRREIECNVRNARHRDELTVRRKLAYSAWQKCKADWVPGWDDKQTAETACAAKLVEHKELAQAVRDVEAKDCSPAVAK
jgi:hypothetical protein